MVSSRLIMACVLAGVLVSFRAAGGMGEPTEAAAKRRGEGELIIFVSPDGSRLATEFETRCLPEITELTRELRVAVKVVDVRRGVPRQVGITPLLMYQDHRGRSLFQGRYTGLKRIRNFIRTSRAIPQGSEPRVLRDVPVWLNGRAKIAASLKISGLAGSPPSDYSPASFEREAREAIRSSLTRFKDQPIATLGRSDRIFYLDFNPWLGEDGTMFLSVALFSQFHCKKAIFTQAGEQIQGGWASRRELFASAARLLEGEVVKQLAKPGTGDGFAPIPLTTPIVTWEELGLALPARPTDAAEHRVLSAVPLEWTMVAGDESSESLLTFRFPAPLDGYAGEVLGLSGRITLATDGSFSGATGWFEADPSTVTMGDPDLDHTLQGAVYLATKKHPRARFEIASIEGGKEPVGFGRLTRASMRGTFTMKGVSVPLVVPVQVEAIMASGGKPRLAMEGGFELSLVPFGMEGPDGPSTAKETLLFDFSFLLQPNAAANAPSPPGLERAKSKP